MQQFKRLRQHLGLHRLFLDSVELDNESKLALMRCAGKPDLYFVTLVGLVISCVPLATLERLCAVIVDEIPELKKVFASRCILT